VVAETVAARLSEIAAEVRTRKKGSDGRYEAPEHNPAAADERIAGEAHIRIPSANTVRNPCC